MWTPNWGLKSGPRFGAREKKKQFGGPQNGVQISHPILGPTLPIIFREVTPEKNHILNRILVSRFVVLTATCPRTGEDLAEGASFWHAFLTPFWGPETIVIFKRNYVEAMCGLSQIQDKPSKSFDQNQPDITFGKRSSPKHKRP